MLFTAEIDGIPCTLEKLPDGSIRVVHESSPANVMHGAATDGEVSYIVHPAQRHQYEHLSSLLPPDHRAIPREGLENHPWWSYHGAAKDMDPATERGGES